MKKYLYVIFDIVYADIKLAGSNIFNLKLK